MLYSLDFRIKERHRKNRHKPEITYFFFFPLNGAPFPLSLAGGVQPLLSTPCRCWDALEHGSQ